MTDFARMAATAKKIVDTVEIKDRDYGSSWKRRGGPGAFMVMARKWDRLENFAKGEDWDIFDLLRANKGDIRDDVMDLIGYLLLILDEVEPLDAPQYVYAPQGQRVDMAAAPGPVVRAHPGLPAFMDTYPSDEQFMCEGGFGDETYLFKCRACKATLKASGLQQAHSRHADCPGSGHSAGWVAPIGPTGT